MILIIGYLLGSIPCGLLVALGVKGIDPRRSGSGNIGATNVLRTAGKKEGLLTLLGDLGKGYLAVFLALKFAQGGEVWVLAAGLSAVLGHLYSIFLRFRGGKGVATSLGVLLAIHPAVALATFGLWAAGFLTSKISSVGALIAFGMLPLTVALLQGAGYFLLFSVVVT
ncbi:MAG TPA: glycerol-3-phosphate 1-O-acyltransferase PlsY, partial [Nitrospiria bacterium]|nr:glycerol-3-phosphate 1-O-acyltransferase PlsY [Nitrospiria bacterium]